MEDRFCTSTSRHSVIVRSDEGEVTRPGSNDDRLTHSSYTSGYHRDHARSHAPANNCCHDLNTHVEDISYEQLEARLAQPSQMYLNFKPLLTGVTPVTTSAITNIFQKFSDLVQHDLGLEANLTVHNNNGKQTDDTTEDCNDDNDHNTHETEPTDKDDKRPVSDCHVCGDRAIAHLHYGGICCYSCKAFFRRAVQSGKDKSYKCKKDSQCEVSVNTRRGCQKCRFEKCLAIGMTATWVLSDEQCEIRFGKTKTVKRPGDKEELEEPVVKQMLFDREMFSDNDQAVIDHMVQVYDDSWIQCGFSEKNANLVTEILKSDKTNYTPSEMNSMVSTVIQRGIFAMNNNHHFGQLSDRDRRLLLIKNMNEMCLIRGALRFDAARESFKIDLKGNDAHYSTAPVNAEIREDSLKNLYDSDSITSKIVQLMRRIKKMDLPTEVFIIMINIVGFAADGLELEDRANVEDIQSQYMSLLHRYLIHLYSSQEANKILSKVIAALVELREKGDLSKEEKINSNIKPT